MRGTVVIGEGEKDEAPMLFDGEELGDGTGPEVDIAVGPVDGTTLTATSLPNALAIVTMAAMKDLGIPADKVNVNGGAVALGHPIGATGARIITTLIYALKKRGLKKGVAALCIGGGEGTAIALEVL